jgi:undecaprenyl diphosphate synthase
MATSTRTRRDATVRPRAAPEHVAIIMDGNGRWAKERRLPRLGGHQAGTNNLLRVVREFADHGVKFLTIYAFSTENWSRPKEEVQGLWRLLNTVIQRHRDELHRNGVKLLHLGRRDRLSSELLKSIDDATELTKDNSVITLCVALDYGGRAEIVQAVKRLMAEAVPPEEVTEEILSQRLYTAGIPDPDLVIRTAGEMRMSNFLTWQSAYAEYYTTSKYWPDFDEAEIGRALSAYSRRERRFGGINVDR